MNLPLSYTLPSSLPSGSSPFTLAPLTFGLLYPLLLGPLLLTLGLIYPLPSVFPPPYSRAALSLTLGLIYPLPSGSAPLTLGLLYPYLRVTQCTMFIDFSQSVSDVT